MKDEAPELLPCPFCGGAAVREARLDCSIVRCINRHNGCSVNMRTHKCATLSEAIAAWNTRAPSPAPEITEEMVERAIEAALPELQRREALMADPMTLDRIQTRRIVRAALTAALATQKDRDE